MSTPRSTRIAKNETRFRDINERLEHGLRRLSDGPELLEFVCECGDRSCEQHVRLTLTEYEGVRRDSRHFAVVPGHVARETERVVAGNDRYEVVEKFGSPVAIADVADQRSPGEAGQRDDADLP
jgi:hypothetical protein